LLSGRLITMVDGGLPPTPTFIEHLGFDKRLRIDTLCDIEVSFFATNPRGGGYL